MTMPTSPGTEDRLECSYKGDELEEEEADEGEEEGGDEEYVCLPQNGKTEEEEEEEEQVLCEVLCADRVGQMTKTYSDIDAVTRLLEEKERDLELAARIGQSLLKKNKTLSDRNGVLEEQVEHIREEVSQLRHDLSMKDELLQFYTSVAEESEGESTTSTPIRQSDPNVTVPTYLPLDSLQKKLKDLEAENISLRSEATHLETETISYEEKEQQLVNDCVKELRCANMQMSSLAEELGRKSDDASRQQEEITHLLSQIVDLQKKAKSYAVENEELTQHLGAAKDAQRQLTAELRELEDKYAECMEMLHEAQEELKNLRNKTLPLTTPRRFHSLGLFPMDSLAAEIEGNMRKELQMDDPDVEEQKLHPKRVFQTVKNLNLMRQQRSSLAPSPLNIPGSNQTSSLTSGRSSRVGTPHSYSTYGGSESGSGPYCPDNKAGGILEAHDDGSDDSNRRPVGTPGTPGGRDLEAALRRLSLRRDNYVSERRFFEEERERKLAYLAKEEQGEDGEEKGGSGGDPGTPTESLLSLYTHPSLGSMWSGYSFTSRSYLPEKLQIVKPLEGSATLHAWQLLAQPHLGGLLDHRPGVVTKGFRTLDQDQDPSEAGDWQLDQPEEDDDSLRSFPGLSSEDDLPVSRLPWASTPDLRHSTNNGGVGVHRSGRDNNNDNEDNSLLESLRGARPGEAFGGKDGPALDGLPCTPCSIRSSPVSVAVTTPCADEKAGGEPLDFPALPAGAPDGLPAIFPGKCMSQTSSTYTFTTCRILHPSDQLTSVSSSPRSAYQSSPGVGGAASPVPSPLPQFSDPATPSNTTPCCTPRRLSLSQAESSTNHRDNTRTTSTSLGLVRLLVEHGISASVYDPRSWDRGGPAAGGALEAEPEEAEPEEEGEELWEDEDRGEVGRPSSLLFLPSTPPNSPTRRCRSRSMSSSHPRGAPPPAPTPPPPPGAGFQFSPTDEPLFYETFLASRPAQTILKEVLAEFEREPALPGSYQSRLEATNLRLVDKLKRFRTLGPPRGGASAAMGGGLGPVLNAGLRRNRSYPAMVGASMAMKDPGGPPSSAELFLGHALSTQHADAAHVAPTRPPEERTHAAAAAVVPNIVSYRQPWPDD
ncbi:trafficking kinesin-binding protein 1 isoform X3 [Gadus chalcogrammus]|uniref:trafficking kinesin-binding protein 1 isoform X3 n=1 Tax=Gadus chalcogrammus TaxID=1042646 RepID=UPI0024C4B6F7|nr:trafficking kinesin-binding protein 1 isoform X3 [Gadus chalcogrammus]